LFFLFSKEKIARVVKRTNTGIGTRKLAIASSNQIVELNPRVICIASPITPITANMSPRKKQIETPVLKRSNDFTASLRHSKDFSDSFSMISPPFKSKRF
jgi:hypothetical protein